MALNISPQAEAALTDLARTEGVDPTVLFDKIISFYQIAQASDNAVASLRARLARPKKNAPPRERISEAEKKLRRQAADELTAEIERLGQFK